MHKFRDSIVGAIVILGVICLVFTLGLSATNALTKDIISANQAASSFGAFEEIFPDAKFTAIDSPLPEGVSQGVSTADGNYVFAVTTKGYGGDVTYIIGLDSAGAYSGIIMGENTETPGIGSKVAAPEYLAGLTGMNSSSDVDSIAGATVTSNSLKKALDIATEAFKLVA